jgi:hypothetical protein
MYAVIAVAVGVVIGLLRGGSFSNLAEKPFRAIPLLMLGIGLQVVTEVTHLPNTVDMIAVLVSYAALALFAALNLQLAGMGVVAIGLVLNIIPISVNQGMPIKASALVRSGLYARESDIHHTRFGGKRHLAGPDDHLVFLGDILPDWLFHEVLSFGDLTMSAGIAAVACNLLLATRRRTSDAPASTASDGLVAGVVEVPVERVEGRLHGGLLGRPGPADAHALGPGAVEIDDHRSLGANSEANR